MAKVELLMPKMGESIMEATILKWLKKPGDTIALDEAVLEIATDKVDSEVPSPVAGVLAALMFEEGAVVPVGGILAVIETEAGATVSPSPAVAAPAPQAASAPVAAAMPAETANLSAAITTKIESPAAGRFYSPLVLNIANQEGVSMQELENLPGTGNEGRVTKKDILQYVADKKAGKITANAAPAVAPAPAAAVTSPIISSPAPAVSVTPAPSVGGNMEIIEMDRMRRMIADNMIASKRTSAHVTSFVEADMTNVVMWRDKVKKEFEQRYGEKLTFTPIFIEAAVKAIQDFPMINVSVDGTNLIVKKDINIGMAAALPSGNLIVPVIHNADQFNLAGLAKRVNDLANRARTNKLKPDEIQGGTYTISNVGSFGNVMGTPIIPQPQVAIMAVGAIRKKPAVIETESGDLIGIRSMMFLSHSYDHRVVDGALGGMFVRRMADYLEQWDMNRPI
jgi:2-oxoglutarate dehydrogenase E2 component (dihydrolipoamide succinyltransferase)